MHRAGVVFLIVASALTARPAAGQTTSAWEVEVFAGGVVTGQPSSGTSALPDPGAPFTTLAFTPSRRVSSWYFGDGALLLNQVLQAFGRSERITPLDRALTTSALHRENGGALGARVRRNLTPRLAAELSLEYGLGRMAVTEEGLEAIEASRASFTTAWSGLFAAGTFSSPSITSAKTIGSGGRQVLTTGALNFTLKSAGRFRPYVTGGAGIVSNLGDPPEVALTGEYKTFFASLVPIAERDSVKLRYTVPGRAIGGLVGGGLTYSMSRRWGLRGDVRVHLWKHSVDSLVDATPFIETRSSPMVVFASATNPSIQFRNFPLPGAGTGSGQPTFGGPEIAGFRTFAGSGMQRQTTMTAGVFWRF